MIHMKEKYNQKILAYLNGFLTIIGLMLFTTCFYYLSVIVGYYVTEYEHEEFDYFVYGSAFLIACVLLVFGVSVLYGIFITIWVYLHDVSLWLKREYREYKKTELITPLMSNN
jgi:hypothetical protein